MCWLQYHRRYSLCCTVHPHHCSVTTNLCFLIPSLLSPSLPRPLPSGSHQFSLCVYESASTLFVHLFFLQMPLINEIIWYFSSSVWLISLCTVHSLDPPMLPQTLRFPSFYGHVTFHRIYVPYIYLFTSETLFISLFVCLFIMHTYVVFLTWKRQHMPAEYSAVRRSEDQWRDTGTPSCFTLTLGCPRWPAFSLTLKVSWKPSFPCHH